VSATGYLMVAALVVMAVVVVLVVVIQGARNDEGPGSQPGRTRDCPIPSGIECPFHQPSVRGCVRCREERRLRLGR